MLACIVGVAWFCRTRVGVPSVIDSVLKQTDRSSQVVVMCVFVCVSSSVITLLRITNSRRRHGGLWGKYPLPIPPADGTADTRVVPNPAGAPSSDSRELPSLPSTFQQNSKKNSPNKNIPKLRTEFSEVPSYR
jgi:hypothetical protein